MGPMLPQAQAQPLVQPIPTMGQQLQPPAPAAQSGMDPAMAAIFQQMVQGQSRPQGSAGGLTANMLAQAILEAKYRNAKNAGQQSAPGMADPMTAGVGNGGMGQMPVWPSSLPPLPPGGFGG